MTNFLERAKRRWPKNVVGGSGRFAVVTSALGPMSKILLFETYTEARCQILDPKYASVVDLAVDGEALLAKIPDLYDPEERKRERQQLRVQVTDFGDR
jgi:hypothetical protein